jgi:hypothetical protein
MITANLGPASKASDVIAVKLGCGHIMGEAEYKEYAEIRRKIMVEQEQAVRKINDEASRKLAAAFIKLQADRGVKE